MPGRPRGESEDPWILLSLGLATAIAVTHGLVGGELVVVGLLALPPILAAATTGARATAVIAAYCFVLALVGAFWAGDGLSDAYIVRLLIVGLAAYLSFWSATAREELTASARGGAVLAEGFALTHTLDEKDMVEQLAEVAVPDLADVAVVDIVLQDGTITAAAVAADNPEVTVQIERSRAGLVIDPGSDHPVAEVVRTGERRAFRNMGDAAMREMAIDQEHLEMVRDVRPRSLLVVPLKVRNETFGALSLGSLHDDDRYGRDEGAFAVELANRAAVAIQNARLHDEQSRLARALQESLLPPALPQINGLEVAARYRPLGLGTEIGGDFFDLFQLDRASWAAVIGDVCGKGPEAAALTSLMRDTLRSSALRGESPSETLSLLNAAIIDAGVDGRYCTSAYARVDLEGPSRLTVCNGGHPPPLILRHGGGVEPVGPPGTLLGIWQDVDLSDTSVSLKPGDLVMLYTDGLFESRPGSNGSIEPVEQILARCKGMSAEETAETVEARALAGLGDAPQDDMAILVLRRPHGHA